MRYLRFVAAVVVLLAAETTNAVGVADLRLVPFPKQVEIQPGDFSLSGKLVLESPAADAEVLGRVIGGELRAAGLPAPEVRAAEGKDHFFHLTAAGRQQPADPFSPRRNGGGLCLGGPARGRPCGCPRPRRVVLRRANPVPAHPC